HLTIAARLLRADHRLHAAEELLMFDLVAREAHERFERMLIAERMLAALIEHLGADEALDQPEDVGVRAALDLAEQTRLVVGQKGQAIDLRQAVRQELARKIERAPLQQVAIDLPLGLAGRADNLSVSGSRIHVRTS